jgi:2-polyprenyl-3-methyl-5-hydroxy-6-metoxy-1,4-benzoquinol methylase
MKYDLTLVTDGSCPVCASGTGKQLYQVTSSQAAQHFARAELDREEHAQFQQEIESLWGRERARLVQCDHCGFCYASPYVAGSPRFYAMLLKSPDFPRWRWEFEVTRACLKQLASGMERPRLLEIGAGDGAFIRSISPDIFSKQNVLCTEYSPRGANTIRDYGVSCEMVDVRALRQAGYGDFSFVCLFQVLEHLDDLDGFFIAINDLVSRRADLFISVPNADSITFSELNGGLLDMPPNHVGRWNRTCFEVLGGRHGWRVAGHELERAGLRKLAMHLGQSRYMQLRSVPGSLANRTSLFKNRFLRRLFGIPMFAGVVIGALPAALRNHGRCLGGAQWVHLQRY